MLAEAVAQEMQKVYKTELGPEPVPLTIDGEAIDEDEVSVLLVCNILISGKMNVKFDNCNCLSQRYFLGVDNVSEGEDDADVEKEVSKAGNKYALFKEKSLFFFLLHTPLVKSWISMFLKMFVLQARRDKEEGTGEGNPRGVQ